MPSQYRLRRRVQFYETDLAGIVHFSWFFRDMEEAEHALWREAGLSIAAPRAEGGFPPLPAARDFRAPPPLQDEVETWIPGAGVTRRSMRHPSLLTPRRTRSA